MSAAHSLYTGMHIFEEGDAGLRRHWEGEGLDSLHCEQQQLGCLVLRQALVPSAWEAGKKDPDGESLNVLCVGEGLQ